MLEKNSLKRWNLGDSWTKFFLIFNAFSWYFMILRIRDNMLRVPEMSNSAITISIVFSCGIIISSLVGALLSLKVTRNNLLIMWIVIGAISSFLPIAIVYDQTTPMVIFVFSILGLTFGFGVPSCLAYFSDHTMIEKRGLSAGIIFVIVNVILFPIIALLGTLTLLSSSVFLAVWRMLGLLYLLPRREENEMPKFERPVPFFSILTAKSFLLYFLPWFAYSLLEAFENVVVSNFLKGDTALLNSIGAMAILLAPLSVLLGGFFADQIGRRRVAIYGFAALGLGYALVGLLPGFVASWYFYAIAYGISTGVLMLIFVPVLWGDLSESNSRERYYAIGSIPFFAANIIQALSNEYVALVPVYASFSLASFFLFLAVLSLAFASETLPEKEIEKKRLKKYLETAKKIKEKY